jgi:hypothetical protein
MLTLHATEHVKQTSGLLSVPSEATHQAICNSMANCTLGHQHVAHLRPLQQRKCRVVIHLNPSRSWQQTIVAHVDQQLAAVTSKQLAELEHWPSGSIHCAWLLQTHRTHQLHNDKIGGSLRAAMECTLTLTAWTYTRQSPEPYLEAEAWQRAFTPQFTHKASSGWVGASTNHTGLKGGAVLLYGLGAEGQRDVAVLVWWNDNAAGKHLHGEAHT